ncbi:putative TonB C-terminal domain-containing protein [Pararobbsia alpina]|uniref:hypothetical protein n=1 Tax=Pararobbsia alpina TaxID=621374 RepID=UPI0039A75B4F
MKPGSRLHALWFALLASIGQASAQTVQLNEAPPAWIEYAQRVSERMQSVIGSEDDRVVEFRSYFAKQFTTPAGQPLGNLFVEVWIDRSGHITRVEFDPDGDPAEMNNLRRVMTSIVIGLPPPSDMKQPVVVKLGLGEQT